MSIAAEAEATDHVGLIRESYNIDGISRDECRSIFLDWLLRLPFGADQQQAARAQLAIYQHRNPAHPMTTILLESLAPPPAPARRGGRKGRLPPVM